MMLLRRPYQIPLALAVACGALAALLTFARAQEARITADQPSTCTLDACPEQTDHGVHYVATGGDCGEATPCYSTIQEAVDAAQPGDEIRVAAGHFTDVHARPRNDIATSGVVTQVVYVSKTVAIQGGYTTTNWTTPYPITQPTTLDAQGRGRVIYITSDPSAGSGQAPSAGSGQAPSTGSGQAPSTGSGQAPSAGSGQAPSTPNGTFASGQAPSTGRRGELVEPRRGELVEPRRGELVEPSGQAVSPTIGGLRITGGNAGGLGGHTTGGTDFDGGGGVYVVTATATLIDNQVFGNTADAGGGLYLYSRSSLLSGNGITGNVASDGGGLYLHDSAAALSGNAVRANTAHWAGGGLYLENSAARLSQNTVASNTAYLGGGLHLDGSGAMLSGNAVTSNTAGAGGGLYLEESTVSLAGDTVIANDALRGGGLFLGFSDATLTNVVIADNSADSEGDGLYVLASSTRLLHTTIARNGSAGLAAGGSAGLAAGGSAGLAAGGSAGLATGDGGDGSGVYVIGSFYGDSSTVALTNTILVSHSVGITVAAGSTATLEATLWGTGTWANTTDWAGEGAITTGTVNLQGDPAFGDPSAGDYHIGLASTAIDQGVNAGVDDDIDGEPRPLGDGYDIGADEAALHPIYLPLVLRDVPLEITTVTGNYVLAGNPCTTEPCLPGLIYAVSVDDDTYYLTLKGSWLWRSRSWDGYTPDIGDLVRVTGYVDERVDILGDPFHNLEVVSLQPTAQPPAPAWDIEIVDLVSYGGGAGEPGEYVEIRNNDTQPVQLNGWTLCNANADLFTFPSHLMQPAQVCRVYTNEDHPEWCSFSCGSGSAIWDDAHDCAYLRDSVGTLVDVYCYCQRHTAYMTLAATARTLKVGEVVTVTTTLFNRGCVGLGIPQYRLYVRSDEPHPIFDPDTPEPVVHYLAVAPGQSDVEKFVLQAVGPGQARLSASASFEVHLPYPGGAYWGASGTGPLTITVTP